MNGKSSMGGEKRWKKRRKMKWRWYCWREQLERGTRTPLEKGKRTVREGEEEEWEVEEKYKREGGEDEALVGGFELPLNYVSIAHIWLTIYY